MAVRCLSFYDDFVDRRMMDALGAIFEALMFFFGIYQEHEVTKEQCERMWEEGYVVYPLSEAEHERAIKCRDLKP